MIKAFLIHLAHKIKFHIQPKKPFSGRGILLKWAHKILTEPTGPLTIKTLDGFKLRIDPVKDKGVERVIYFTGTYEAGTLHVLGHLLKAGNIYLDVGSNIGLMAIFAARNVGKKGQVHAFEPEPETYTILEHNCRINSLKNIVLNNVALGAEEKEATIYANLDTNRGAASLVRQDGSAGKKISVTTLDAYLAAHSIGRIQVMKIDIEGYEMEMLKGATKLLSSKDAPVICIEYSRDVEHTGDATDIYDFIKGINEYRVFKFSVWKGEVCPLQEVYSKADLPQHDNIFCFLPQQLLQAAPSLFKNEKT